MTIKEIKRRLRAMELVAFVMTGDNPWLEMYYKSNLFCFKFRPQARKPWFVKTGERGFDFVLAESVEEVVEYLELERGVGK